MDRWVVNGALWRYTHAVKARDVLGPRGALSTELPTYRSRDSQLRMADAVERHLDGGGILLVEAGTGTGKTLAYLVPAILSGKRVVISTGTRTLQDQIVRHDIPLLERTLGRPIAAASLKGIANYVCRRRYEEFRASASAVSSPARQGLPIVEEWLGTTPTGDRADLHDLGEDAPLWSRILSSTETRIGSRCSFYEDCFVTQRRRDAEEAQILVVNHHVYFADLATRGPAGGGFLPDHDAVIFDEAHQLEDTIGQFFGVQVSVPRVEGLCRDARTSLQDIREPVDAVIGVEGTSRSFFAALPGARDGSRVAFDHGRATERLREAYHRFDAALEVLELLGKRLSDRAETFRSIGRRSRALRDELAVVMERPDRDRVAWVSGSDNRVRLGASPVDVSAIFAEEVLLRKETVVLTSATLSIGGSYDFLRTRLGILEGSEELELESPFDFPTQAA
ncbi:MAG: ATP-dependent DNA helicase, partial [Myxococcales bacterium]|nr:ATP-dependent DNA helicase [Myxococcales bacterium]